MSDTEKIIRGLEVHSGSNKETDCEDCPYDNDMITGGHCIEQLCADALELIKEQRRSLESIVPVNEDVKIYNKRIYCSCGHPVDIRLLFKDKDPVEPEIHMGGISLRHDDPELTVYCGACKGEMVHKYAEYPIDVLKRNYRFCHHCGREVKWA